ncbi:thermonuclease family protein [Sphingobium yanoikuyae]|uniref:thermonuclease family protein n=1 Tax=Sphingobium yanoikuyae TaxID=13690 RepID=UPI003B920C85
MPDSNAHIGPASWRPAIPAAKVGAIGLLVLAVLAPAQAANPPPARTGQGRVRYVTDGDTFRLSSGERIRIAGIDAPETQARNAKCAVERRRGEAAKAWLKSQIEGRKLRFERLGRSYARTVATVRFEGKDLAAILVAKGHADWWPRGRAKPDWCRSR